jgi:hypothetical protein
MAFWNNLWQTAKKAVGSFGGVVRGVGTFIKENHHPIALMAHGIGQASGNKTLENIGNAALFTSGALTGLGVGRDYSGLYK